MPTFSPNTVNNYNTLKKITLTKLGIPHRPAGTIAMETGSEKPKTTRMFGQSLHILSGIMYAERFSDRLPSASVSCCIDRPGEEIVMQDTYMVYDKQLFHASSVGEVPARSCRCLRH